MVSKNTNRLAAFTIAYSAGAAALGAHLALEDHSKARTAEALAHIYESRRDYSKEAYYDNRADSAKRLEAYDCFLIGIGLVIAGSYGSLVAYDNKRRSK